MDTPEPLGKKFLNFIVTTLLPINMVGWGIATIVVVVNWDDLGDAAFSLFVEKAVNLGVVVALFIGLRQRINWAWWLLMATLVLSPMGSAYSRYEAQALKANLYNLYAERVNKTPMAADPTPFVILGLLGFCLITIPSMIYFYNRRSWFGVTFDIGAMTTTDVGSQPPPINYSKPITQGYQKTALTLSEQTPSVQPQPPYISVSASSPEPTDVELDNRDLYAQAYREAQDESNSRDVGLWAMAFAQNDGNTAKSQAEYVKMRVASLVKDRKELLEIEAKQRAQRIAEEQDAEVKRKREAAAIKSQKEAEERIYNAERAALKGTEEALKKYAADRDLAAQLAHLPPLVDYTNFHADTRTLAIALNQRITSAQNQICPIMADEIRDEIANFTATLDTHFDTIRRRSKYLKWYDKYLADKECAADLPSAWEALLASVHQRFDAAFQANDFSKAISYAALWTCWDVCLASSIALKNAHRALDAHKLVSDSIIHRRYESILSGLQELICLFGSGKHTISIANWEGTLEALMARAQALEKSRKIRVGAIVMSCSLIAGVVIFGGIWLARHFERQRVSELITSTVLPHLLSPTNAIDAAKSAMTEVRATSKRADAIFASLLVNDLTQRADKGDAAAANAIALSYAIGFGFTTNQVEAFTWYRKAAEQGYAKAQYNLGSCYASGEGVSADKTEAVRWFSKAAEQGYAVAQNMLGVCYYNGEGVSADKTEAVKWFRKTAEQGDANAQNMLGICYYNGDGVPADKTEAVKWFRKAAEQGLAMAQYKLGLCYYNGEGVSADKTEAVKWFRKTAEQGDAMAQCILGLCYASGEGVSVDKAEAVKWYRRAAEQGHAEAQYFLGLYYHVGDGMPVDKIEAVKWYRLAAEQGYAMAQNNLGSCYYNGEGVPVDLTEAVKWHRKAAEQGYAVAQCFLGVCYSGGEGVPVDWTEAVKWFRMAAEQGYAVAQCMLGVCYTYGVGGHVDLTEAVKWYRMAASREMKKQKKL